MDRYFLIASHLKNSYSPGFYNWNVIKSFPKLDLLQFNIELLKFKLIYGHDYIYEYIVDKDLIINNYGINNGNFMIQNMEFLFSFTCPLDIIHKAKVCPR